MYEEQKTIPERVKFPNEIVMEIPIKFKSINSGVYNKFEKGQLVYEGVNSGDSFGCDVNLKGRCAVILDDVERKGDSNSSVRAIVFGEVDVDFLKYYNSETNSCIKFVDLFGTEYKELCASLYGRGNIFPRKTI